MYEELWVNANKRKLTVGDVVDVLNKLPKDKEILLDGLGRDVFLLEIGT